MKALEACQKRIPRVRLEVWANPNAYLRLPLFQKGYGPWAELYDDDTQERVLGMRPGSQRLCLIDGSIAGEDGFVEYTGPVSKHEQDQENFARGYAET